MTTKSKKTLPFVDWDKVIKEAWADLEGSKMKCRVCGFPFHCSDAKDKDEFAAMDLRFCSVSCLEHHRNKNNNKTHNNVDNKTKEE